MIKLTITEKGGEPRALSFDQTEVSIGRVQGNDIVLPKGNISKRHSKLVVSDGRLTVTDAKSTNGTYVNGRKIGEPTPVRPGDKIFVGDFLIVIDPAAAAAETSGARRGPPPPPPPPPRPGTPARPLPSLALDEGNEGAGGGFGDLDDEPPSTGSRGRPPAPPPPPPMRRTIVTTSLQDDSVDIGADEPPPSPADIGNDNDLAGDVLANLGSDMEASNTGSRANGDAGSDVFGSRAADDEDADLAGTPMPSARQSSGAALNTENGRGSAAASYARPAAAEGPAAANSIEGLLADPTVAAIIIVGGNPVQVERGGKLESAGNVGDQNTVAETVWQLANAAVPPPPADNPVVDVRLLDGTRVTALFPPISGAAVSATLRKATVPEMPLAEIAGSADVEKILTAALTSRRNLLLCGDPSACTALAGALAGAVPADRRVVSIGAGAKSRPGWIELSPAGDPSALVRAAVAFRADHLLVADAGGAELPELLLAAARGQEGVLGTMAARSADEALARLRAFAVGAVGAAGFASLVASSIDLIVLAATTPTGAVRVVEMAEPQADGEALVPAFVARRSDRSRGAGVDISGVSTRLAAAIAVVTDGLPGHLIHR